MLEFTSYSVDLSRQYPDLGAVPEHDMRFLGIYSTLHSGSDTPTIEAVNQSIEKLWGSECYAAVLDSDRQTPIGVVSLKEASENRHLDVRGIVTAQQYRGKHLVGPFMLLGVTEIARARSLQEVRLFALADRFGFYARHGFSSTDDMKAAFGGYMHKPVESSR